jgi:hypothetical protein
MNTFLEETTKYLLDVLDDELMLPTFSLNEINDDGTMIHHVSCKEICAGDKIKPTNVIKYITLFMMFDSFIEKKYPSFIGCDFSKRYSKLPEKNVNQKLEKICYCILLIIRNTIIHHMEYFLETSERIEINYLQNRNQIKLILTHLSLKYIMSYITYRIRNEIINNVYLERYSNEYLRLIKDGIEDIRYKNQNVSKKISKLSVFKLNRCYVVVSDLEKMEWTRKILIDRNNDNTYDIVIKKNGNTFIIPLYEYTTIEEMIKVETTFFEINKSPRLALQASGAENG